jgi:hypothetical protein
MCPYRACGASASWKHSWWITVTIIESLENQQQHRQHISRSSFHLQSSLRRKIYFLLGVKSRHVWINFREIPPEKKMYNHTRHLIRKSKADNWTVHLFDHDKKDEFMRLFYTNTSILWAYEMINRQALAAAGDIWRYSVLYALGSILPFTDMSLNYSYH